MLSRDDLHDYQRNAAQFIIDKRRCILLLEMGLGKTVSALTAVSDLIDGCAVGKVLIIAPLRVAKSVWAQEVKKWAHLSHLSVSVCTGSSRDRLKALSLAADVYVINRENVPWLVQIYGEKWPFDMVVVDESSSFKNPSSLRFKSLRKTLPHTRYMVMLTGTPSPNGLHDVWSQCYLVDFGASLGRTITQYRQRFFDKDFFGHSYVIRSDSAHKIHDLMRPYTLSMQAKDYIELPNRIDLVESIQLEPKVMRGYLDFEKNLFMDLPDGKEIEALSAGVLAGKLLQYASGAMYTDSLKNWSLVHDEKIEALRELREANEAETMLIAYNFNSDLERLRAAFPEAVVLDQSEETIARWNRGEISMLLAHPASAGHGLNLQHGGSLAVWFSLTWSLEYYLQFNARLYRQGQTRPVRIVHLIAQGTIDDRVMSVLSQKDVTQNQLMKALGLPVTK